MNVIDAAATTVGDLKGRIFDAEEEKGPAAPRTERNSAIQFMVRRRPLKTRVAAATTTNSSGAVSTDAAAADGELISLPDGIPIAALLDQSSDAACPLHLFALPSDNGARRQTLVLFYLHRGADSLLGIDCKTVCICVAVCACIATCIAVICCCKKNDTEEEQQQQPSGNATNPYSGGNSYNSNSY